MIPVSFSDLRCSSFALSGGIDFTPNTVNKDSGGELIKIVRGKDYES